MKKVLVIGGTGVLGTSVANTLRKQQVDFIVGSRRPIKTDAYSRVNQSNSLPWIRIDLATGEGLPEALVDVDTVFHLASAPTKIGNEPFEVVTTRNLLNALRKSPINHLIYSSIVGVDKIPFSYHRSKLEAERLIQESGLPFSILRATQFHNLIDFVISKLLYLPIGFVPNKLLVQPIHVDTVRDELYQLMQKGPQQTVINLGGPKQYDLGTMTKLWMNARQINKPIVSIPTVGALMKSLERGENTCPEKTVNSPNWEEYLYATSNG